MPLIAYSVGERGLISQILSPKFGGFLVYGSMEGNTVPGLPTLDSLTQAYKVKYINAYTKVLGLISKPVSHSKGPLLHNPTFRHVNYNGIYVPMLVDDLKEFFSVYSSPDFAGFRYVICKGYGIHRVHKNINCLLTNRLISRLVCLRVHIYPICTTRNVLCLFLPNLFSYIISFYMGIHPLQSVPCSRLLCHGPQP